MSTPAPRPRGPNRIGIRGPGTGRKRKDAVGEPLRPGTITGMCSVSGPQWLDTREAAALLGVTPDGVAGLVSSGRLRRHTRPACFPHFSRREVVALAAELAEETS